jgi:hypothetical protein
MVHLHGDLQVVKKQGVVPAIFGEHPVEEDDVTGGIEKDLLRRMQHLYAHLFGGITASQQECREKQQ